MATDQFTNNMSIQRITPEISGGLTQNSHLAQVFNQSFQDQLLYGSSGMRTFINSDGEPELERIDPRDMTTGRGLEDQISSGNNQYFSRLTEEDIREVMNRLTTTGTTSPTYTVLTGTSGMTNIQQAMSTYANTGWITTNHIEPQYSKEEFDIYKNSIYPMVSTKDYKTFEIRVQKENCDIVYTTNKGDKRTYDLLLKNAKRGVYMKANKQDWKYEFK